jgi:DNA-binding NtrC family response regulator
VSAESAETREDDGKYDASSQTCVVLSVGGRRRIVELRDHAGAEVVLGRSRECTFVVDDHRVSRRHLRLVCREGALYAEDLGSRNGSTLNGRRLRGERPLHPGDELVAGPISIVVCGAPAGAHALLPEGELFRRLQSEVERAQRFGRPLAVAGLVLGGRPAAVHEAALRVASRLGRIELIGEYAPGEYLVLLPETAAATATAAAERLAAVARQVAGVEASARAASIRDGGNSADELIAATLGSAGPPSGAARGENEEQQLVAEDECTRQLFAQVRRAARANVTVLVVGETGSGKEVVSAELHRGSERAAGPHVRLNCAALPQTLLESELFGHEKGAFTGADRRRIGYIEAANGGTLFLDEIGEIPLGMQAKLLRVIEDRRVVRVGGSEEIAVDVRFVAATNRDLEREVAHGSFRQDLFFRLSPITLHVPPLRERPRDLELLAEGFAHRAAFAAGHPPPALHPSLLRALKRYPWPGNVRELRNVIERAVIFSDAPELSLEHLPERLVAVADAPPPTETVYEPMRAGPMRGQLDELERRNLVEALLQTSGNRTHAAQRLGISRRALHYKLKKHGLK